MLAKYPSALRCFFNPEGIGIHDGHVKCGDDMKCMNSINRAKDLNAESLLISIPSETSHNN
jgi:hypothetical protein